MHDKSRRKLIIIFLLVLLLHILLFLFLFFIPMHERFLMPPVRPEALNQQEKPSAQKPQEQMENKPEEQKEKEKEWASLKPAAGSFGAPVIMYDEPDDADLPTIPDSQPEEKEPEAQEREPEKESEDIPLEKQPAQEPDQHEETTAPDTAQALQELIDALDSSQPLAAASNEPQQTPKKNTVRQRRVRKKRLIKKKNRGQRGKNITLADITEGFLEHWKNKGPNLVRMYGNDNAAPTEEQIRYERYAARILWCLQNAWNIKLSQAPTQVPLESDMHICMVISKEGKLDAVNIVRSCGRSDIDKFMVDTIQYAGTSFPPLPGFIKEVPFYMPWIIKIQLGSHATRPRFSMH